MSREPWRTFRVWLAQKIAPKSHRVTPWWCADNRDADRLDWLEEQARKSHTGIAFDWVPAVDGEPSGFRFMRRFFIGESAKTLRRAIDLARKPPADWIA